MRMARRFQLRDHVTEPLYSVTGVPEGCALSCIGMMIIDWTLHAWFTYMMPLARPITYVDDWQFVVRDSRLLKDTMDKLDTFAAMVDLTLDRHKTFTWSITDSGRNWLRLQGYRVAHKARNLGAHMQFTRQHEN